MKNSKPSYGNSHLGESCLRKEPAKIKVAAAIQEQVLAKASRQEKDNRFIVNTDLGLERQPASLETTVNR